ncbi:MAG: DNA mismatch repair endonuclease MutL [Bacteroidetes bacterium]|nr:DNA mismatch repair endonuclease MutL [Bacteroidota bacterium]HET6243379.1 DNA mismatch repair endonuclease MutL [Bacteroidia bacterium]
MADIIQLLPDSVANQIAAGEVVQRPASAVKELLENAIDSGALSIKLIIRDAGKTLIQVIDNGSGMSETDARMCFERHATSKIRKADDLFSIRTMGFRGEAMASIAAIAQVELKTKKEGEDLGTLIEIEGSELIKHEPVQSSTGTSVCIKNLFYNVPARRNFLKSNAVETRHIIEEFQRVALPNPHISFSFYNNDQEVFMLEKSNLRQRVSAIFGNNYNEKLVPVEEDTEIVKIRGFVGKPEFAKRIRGDQYFFVNERFIKSPYLHHAVQTAFEEFIASGTFAAYFLMLDINPSTIDINIHPTKTEIKFEDEKSIYAIIRSSVRQALGKYHITPTLDFDQEGNFNLPLSFRDKDAKMPGIKVNPNFNPFDSEKSTPVQTLQKNNLSNWEQLYTNDFNTKSDLTEKNSEEEHLQQELNPKWEKKTSEKPLYYQLQRTYIITTIKSGLVIINQQRAHERVLFEHFYNSIDQSKGYSQQVLFPISFEFPVKDAQLIIELLPDIQSIGFDIQEFGNNTFIINGIPSGVIESEARDIIEGALEHYKINVSELKLDKKDSLCRAMSKRIAIKTGRNLSEDEMRNLVDELFACHKPYSSPDGKPTVITLPLDELEQKFRK